MRPKVSDTRQVNRKKALNDDLDAATSNTQRISVAAGYVTGAVKATGNRSSVIADAATEVAVNWLVRLGDRLLAGGVIHRDDYGE